MSMKLNHVVFAVKDEIQNKERLEDDVIYILSLRKNGVVNEKEPVALGFIYKIEETGKYVFHPFDDFNLYLDTVQSIYLFLRMLEEGEVVLENSELHAVRK